MVSDLKSVTWTKVSLKEAKIRATPKTSSPAVIVRNDFCGGRTLVFTFSDLWPERDVLCGGAFDLFLWRHGGSG